MDKSNKIIKQGTAGNQTKGLRVLEATLSESESLSFKDVSISAISVITVTASIPLIYLLLRCNANKLEKDPVFIQRYGVLFKGLKLNSGITYQFTTIFLLRRFLFVVTLLTLEQLPYLQLLAQIILSELLICYLIKYRPYDNLLDNVIELVNEITIALVFLFSQGLIHDLPDTFTSAYRENLGSVMISLIALCMIFNVYFFMQNMYRTLIVATCVPLCIKVKNRCTTKAKVEDALELKGNKVEKVEVKECLPLEDDSPYRLDDEIE